MPFLLFVLLLAGAFALAVTTQESRALSHPRHLRSHGKAPPPDLFSSEFDLLDIVLVASVDGKFHALNRSSGHTLWSMSSVATTTSVSAPASLAPLVRTPHIPFLDEDSDDHETYIIEPQSGDIYVLSDPASPLKRFPFSVQELVDMSPFTSSNGEQTRVFVGRKETSLLLIELETGRIKATLNSECPPEWEDEMKKVELDLDDLESEHDAISSPTQVYVGRIDYHISIFKKPTAGQSAPPSQKLLFSAYGTNNRDNHLQGIYRQTKDNSYIQALPNGEVISFRTEIDGKEGGQPMWGRHFSTPVVAIFDVLRTNPHSLKPPFVLLQPRPRLHDLFPNLGLANSPHPVLPNFGSAYVGLLEESGSLFAMSPERYPLVLFGGSERKSGRFVGQDGYGSESRTDTKTLDPPQKKGYRPDGNDEDEQVVLGGAIERGDAEDGDSLLDTCLVNPFDLRCLIGVRPIEDGGGYEGRMKRLLEGPKPVVQQHAESGSDLSSGQGPVVVEAGRQVDDNSSGFYRGPNEGRGIPNSGNSGPTARLWSTWFAFGMLGSESVGGGTFWEMAVVSLGLGVVPLWFVWKGTRRRSRRAAEITKEKEEIMLRSWTTPNGESMPWVGFKQNGTMTEELVSNANESVLSSSILAKELPPLPPSDLPGTHPPDEQISVPTSSIPDTPIPEDADDTEGENEATGIPATPGKKKVRRGKRGKKKKTGAVAGTSAADGNEAEQEKEDTPSEKTSLVLITSQRNPTVQQSSLVVSDTILGFGSHGTVVFQGSLQGRSVAVKRLLRDFVTLADREVSILQESDDHPNVIRYYYQEAHENFLYIALELCPASLADVIENPNQDQWRDIGISFDPKKALKQIASGMRHLHGLKLVHRDIKPQNILISANKGNATSNTLNGRGSVGYRMLISDFGLCKKLDIDQTSFLPTAYGALAAGTVGWRAPEILRGEVKLDEGLDRGSMSSRGSVGTATGSSSSGGIGMSANNKSQARLTKSVDIFSLGCLFYYTLTNGGHPYGDRFEREVNILKDAKDLSGVERFGEEGTEAKDLIMRMLEPNPTQRPDTTTCLLHPYFWDAGRRLNFLQDASDRFEIMCRDPKDPNLLSLEDGVVSVVGNDWHTRLDKVFIENLGKYRKYDGKSLQDLLRALRNKKHHYQDLPDNVKRHLGPMPEGFLSYFTKRYPQLFLHVHATIKETGLHCEPMFRSYFELPDS